MDDNLSRDLSGGPMGVYSLSNGALDTVDAVPVGPACLPTYPVDS